MEAPIRVLIVEDSDVSAKAIRLVLDRDPEFVVVGRATDLTSALMVCGRETPDVVTMDLNLDDKVTTGALGSFKRACEAPVVVVSASIHDRSQAAERALALGAEACFEKSKVLADPDRLLATLRRVANRSLRTTPNW